MQTSQHDMHLLQGWSLDPTHPSFNKLTPDKLLSGESRTSKRDQTSYIQTHTTKLLTHPTLPTHRNGENLLRLILSQPNLAISEDELLQHVLCFTARRLSLPDISCWNRAHVTAAANLLSKFIALLRTDGLGVQSLVRIEELGLVEDDELLRIFRAKALCEGSGRGRAVVVESTHPEDGEMYVTEISVGGSCCVVEFDRRCDVGKWYVTLDRGCENVFVEWKDLWRRRRSVRVIMIPAGRFFVVAQGRGWGWKLFAVSVE